MRPETELLESAKANKAFTEWLHKHGPDDEQYLGYTMSLGFRYNGVRFWTVEFSMRSDTKETHVYEHSTHGVGFVRILE
jgi:hypothetical protein